MIFDNKEEFNFGWSGRWMNGYWIAGTICLIISTIFFINALISQMFIYTLIYQIVGIAILLFSIQLFGGNYVWRKSRSYDYMTLPYTDFLGPNDYIMDACAGSGRTALALSKIMKNGRIVCYDRYDAKYIENGGTELLKNNLKIAGIENSVEIVKGDVTDMDFEDNTFDSVISTYGLDHIPFDDQRKAIKEIYRVTKPKGKLLVVVFIPNIYMFLVGSFFIFLFTSRKKWRGIFEEAGYKLSDEGIINGGGYFLLEKV